MHAFVTPSANGTIPNSRQRIRRAITPHMTSGARARARPRTVVVGAGPTGLAAAYLLNQQGAQVTLVERATDPAKTDPQRAFSYLITPRGMPAMERMNLFDTLAKVGTPANEMNINVFLPKGPPKRYNMQTFVQSKTRKPSYWIARSSLVRLMLDAIEQVPDIEVRTGTSVVGLTFTSEGACIDFQDANKQPAGSMVADLVIACDGINSTVRTLLHDGKVGAVDSSSGFDLSKWNSPSVGLSYKTLVLGPEPLLPPVVSSNNWAPAKPHDAYVFRGQLLGRGNVRLGLLPVGSDKSASRAGTVPMRSNKLLWEAKSADEGYDLLQRNFPSTDVKRLVPRAEMERFVKARVSHFPAIQRANSLVGVSAIGPSGVLLAGDAAHAFPPDLGLGVNSGLEDVLILADCLRSSTNIHDALLLYEAERNDDITALMRIMQLGNPYQYRQDLPRSFLTIANQVFRAKLHQIAPKFFSLQLQPLVLEGRYSVVLKRANETTRNIYVALALLLSASAIMLQAVR